MELLLLAVSAVSLTLALVMSLAVARMSRAERTRAAARVAALSAAASEPEREDVETLTRVAVPVPAENVAVRLAEHVGTRSVVAVAAAPRVVAAQASRQAAPWAASPVVPVPSAFRQAAAPIASVAETLPLQTPTDVGDRFLGATADASGGGGRQRSLAIAAVLLFAIVGGGGYWMVFGSRAVAAPAASNAAEQSPLELVSLRHERKGGKLDVTGLIRNPVGAAAMNRLSAVVFLFDPKGGFLSSARADVDYRTLSPGDESPFVISLDAPPNVARYRVSFRTEAGVVPHIDRRGQEPLAAHAVNERPAVR